MIFQYSSLFTVFGCQISWYGILIINQGKQVLGWDFHPPLQLHVQILIWKLHNAFGSDSTLYKTARSWYYCRVTAKREIKEGMCD